jgi:salicylate hydroxylase
MLIEASVESVSEYVVQDTEAGVVTAENGTSFSADVVIGADGIRSNVRPFVVDCAPPKPSGESAYRLLVDVKDLPHNSPLLVDGKLPRIAHMAKGGQRKIVAYPIRDCTLLNLLAFVRECLDSYAIVSSEAQP